MPLASSIDNFIHMRRDDSVITLATKAALCSIIAEHERHLMLTAIDKIADSAWLTQRIDRKGVARAGDDRSSTITSPKPTWFQYFCEYCFSGASQTSVSEALSRVTVINFNYDRTVERFISLALQAIYNMPSAKASEFASGVKIVHPYGTLGPLTDFGKCPSDSPSGGQIRAFTEGVSGDATTERMGEFWLSAERIVFLGFAFHSQNMQLFSAKGNPNATYQGTSLGLSAASIDAAVNRIDKLLGTVAPRLLREQSPLRPLTCAELLAEEGVWLTE
jgi:hypothetical protein